MNILLVADQHYALKQFDWILSVAPDHDAVVIAGDLLEVASIVPQGAQIVVVTEYLRQLSEKTRVFVCSGNHDLDTEGPGGERFAAWLKGLGIAGVVGDGEAMRVDDVLFSCLPWWEGDATRAAIGAQLARDAARAAGTWVWVYHAPPAESPVSWGGKRSFGDRALSDWIAEYSPALVLSGHVHQAPFVSGGRWVDRVGETWVFNMGQQLGEAPACIVIDTDAREAVWLSLAGAERVDLRAPSAGPEGMTELPAWLRAADPAAR
ncbi:MAG: metallophosphoesterase [Amaricoccus sp.]